MCAGLRALYSRCSCCSRLLRAMAPRSGGSTRLQTGSSRFQTGSARLQGGSEAGARREVRSPRFWQAVLAEFLASFWLVLLGCAAWIEPHPSPGDVASAAAAAGAAVTSPSGGIPAVTSSGGEPLVASPSTALRVALTFGGVYACLSFVFARVSGGHVNPAVTLAWLVLRRISIARAVAYVAAQVLGALLAAVFLLVLVPEPHQGLLGVTVPAPGVQAEQGFAVELFGTALLVLFVVSLGDAAAASQRVAPPGVPFVIGLVYAVVQLATIPISGGSLNPARSLGPAVVADFWRSHWIYWFGPALGALLGALLYDLVFATDSSLGRLRSCMLDHEDGRARASRSSSLDPELSGGGSDVTQTTRKGHNAHVIQTQFPEIVVEQSDDEGSDEEHPAGEGVGPAADRRGAAAGERGPETEALRGEGDVD